MMGFYSCRVYDFKMAKKFSSLSITENLDVKLTCYFNAFFHQSTTPGLATARAFTAIYLTERRLLCVVLSVFSPLQFSVTHFVMLILVVSLSNCVQRQTELRASTFSHICTFVWSCQTMESSHLFKQNQCEIRTIPWGLSWTTQIL